MGGNEALHVNRHIGQHPDLGISVHGSDWYFTVCSVMGFSSLIILGASAFKRESQRLFHYITFIITFVACVAYWSMASGLGQVPIHAEWQRPHSSRTHQAGTREIFWVRYVDWFVTTPLLLLDLLLTAGMPWPSILTAILADEIMIVTGLVGALTSTTYKWGYWSFGMAAFFYVVWALVYEGRRYAAALGTEVHRTYFICGVLTIVLWFLYPVCWGLSEGGNVLHPDSEAVFYGVLDIFAKPGFGFLLLWGHRKIDFNDLGLTVREPGWSKAAVKNGKEAQLPPPGGVDPDGGAAKKETHVGDNNDNAASA